MITEENYQDAKKIIQEYVKQLSIRLEEAKLLINSNPQEEKISYHISVRTFNVLKAFDLDINMSIEEFAKLDLTHYELIRYRNLGKKGIQEINEMLVKFGYKSLKK